MRSMLQAFNLFAMGGMPNAISAGLSMATKSYTPNNLNDGNLVIVYCINAAFGTIGCAIFYWVSCGAGIRGRSREKEIRKSDTVAAKGGDEIQTELSFKEADASIAEGTNTECSI